MDINDNSEIVFQNEYFKVVKAQYSSQDFGSIRKANSTRTYTQTIIIKRGDYRYWIKDANGNLLGDHWATQFGYKTVEYLSSQIIAAEITDNWWRYVMSDGRSYPYVDFSDESVVRIGHFRDGYSEHEWHNGIISFLDEKGRVFLNTPQGEYIPLPEGYLAGMFFFERVIALMDDEMVLHLFDDGFKPLVDDQGERITCDSYEETVSPWVIILRNHRNNIYILNSYALIAKRIHLDGIQSLTTFEISSDCFQVTTIAQVDNNKTSNNVLCFRSGAYSMSSSDYEILPGDKLIIMHQSVNNGCYSFDGNLILKPVYDDVRFDSEKHQFTLLLGDNTMLADGNGRLYIDEMGKRVVFPKQIDYYERVTNELYLVAHYRHGFGVVSLFAPFYGLYNIETEKYQVPCKYSSIHYISDSLIIVKGILTHEVGIIDCYGNVIVPESFYSIELKDNNTLFFKDGIYRDAFTTGLDLMRSINNGDSQVLVPAYYEAMPFGHSNELSYKCLFYNDYCVVKRNGKYGLINNELDEVIPCEYNDVYCIDLDDDALLFAAKRRGRVSIVDIKRGYDYETKAKEIHGCFKDSSGKRFFIIGSTTIDETSETTRYGLMDQKGNIVFDAVYYSIRPIHGDLISISKVVGESKEALADTSGRLLSDFVYYNIFLHQQYQIIVGESSFNSFSKMQNTAFYSKEGVCITDLDSGSVGFDSVTDDIIRVLFAGNNGFVFQLFKISGEQLSAEKYSSIGEFINGEAIVNVGGKTFFDQEEYMDERRYDVHGGKYGVIRIDGTELIKPVYSFIRKNIDGYRVVSEERNGKYYYGLVSGDGNLVIECKYQYLGDTYDHQIIFAEQGEWQHQGNKREALLTLDRYNRWLKNARWGIISIQENVIVPASYSFIYRAIDGVSIFVLGDKYGFYNYQDKLFFIPQYDYLEAFSEGLCVAGQREPSTDRMLYGFINKQNITIIPFTYLRAFHFKDGEARVETEHAFCTINAENKVIRSQDKAELARLREEEAQERARAEFEDYNRQRMIEDGLREAFNGDWSNTWNID